MHKRTSRIALGIFVLFICCCHCLSKTAATSTKRITTAKSNAAMMKSSRWSAWPMFRGDTYNSGCAVSVGPTKPKLLWRTGITAANPDMYRDDSPVLGPDGTLYCPGEPAFAVAPNGRIRWYFRQPQTMQLIVSSVAVGRNGTVYVTTEDFQSDFPTEHVSGRLYALRPNGSVLWTAGITPESEVLIDGTGLIHMISKGQCLVTFDKYGHTLRRIQLPYDLDGFARMTLKYTPEGYQVFTTSDKGLHRISPGGTVRSVQIPNGGSPLDATGLAMSSDGKLVYVCLSDGSVYCLSADKLKLLWCVKVGKSAYYVNPAACNDSVYVVTYPGKLTRIRSDGSVVWEVTFPWTAYSSPTVDKKGKVFVTGGGKLTCVGSDGKIIWSRPLTQSNNEMSSPILGPDGTVYCYSSRVYAVGQSGSPAR